MVESAAKASIDSKIINIGLENTKPLKAKQYLAVDEEKTLIDLLLWLSKKEKKE